MPGSPRAASPVIFPSSRQGGEAEGLRKHLEEQPERTRRRRGPKPFKRRAGPSAGHRHRKPVAHAVGSKTERLVKARTEPRPGRMRAVMFGEGHGDAAQRARQRTARYRREQRPHQAPGQSVLRRVGHGRVMHDQVNQTLERAVLLAAVRIEKPGVNNRHQAHGERRRHVAAYADTVYIPRRDAGVGQQGAQRMMRKTALVLAARIAFLIGSEHNPVAVHQRHAGIKKVFTDAQNNHAQLLQAVAVIGRARRRSRLQSGSRRTLKSLLLPRAMRQRKQIWRQAQRQTHMVSQFSTYIHGAFPPVYLEKASSKRYRLIGRCACPTGTSP